jgi:hypothetical protein
MPTLRARFGDWSKALAAAGIADRFDDSTEAWSAEEIVQHLQSVANSLSGNSVTAENRHRTAYLAANASP